MTGWRGWLSRAVFNTMGICPRRGCVPCLTVPWCWASSGARLSPMPETVVIPAPDGDLPALRFAPSSPNRAGVVVVQEIFGVSNYIVGRCQNLADEGYVVYAPVLYTRLPEKPVLDPSSPDYLAQGMSASSGLDWDTAARDVVAAVATLRAEPCLLYTSPSPRDRTRSRMPSSA